jgi:hypothetical protein
MIFILLGGFFERGRGRYQSAEESASAMKTIVRSGLVAAVYDRRLPSPHVTGSSAFSNFAATIVVT